MRYNIHITANGKVISNVESTVDFNYETADRIVNRYIRDYLSKYKSISECKSSVSSYNVYLNEEKGISVCIKSEYRTILDIKDSEGNNIVAQYVYEGFDPSMPNELSHFTFNKESSFFTKTPFDNMKWYLRNEYFWDRHYDMTCNPPKPTKVINDVHFDVEGKDVQEMIDKYKLKPISK